MIFIILYFILLEKANLFCILVPSIVFFFSDNTQVKIQSCYARLGKEALG